MANAIFEKTNCVCIISASPPDMENTLPGSDKNELVILDLKGGGKRLAGSSIIHM